MTKRQLRLSRAKPRDFHPRAPHGLGKNLGCLKPPIINALMASYFHAVVIYCSPTGSFPALFKLTHYL
jgi:hypothetical protein